METLTPSLTRIIDSTGLRKRLLLGMVPSVWGETVGVDIARHTRVDKVKNGTVFVAADNPVWAQELTFLKLTIIEQLNNRLGEPVVTEIRFRTMGKFDEKSVKGNKVLRPGYTELDRLALTETTREKVEDLVAVIADAELRKRVAAWGIKVLKLREWEKRYPLRKCDVCGKRFRSRRKKCPHCSES